MILRFDTIDSTNTYLKTLAQQGAEAGTAVIAAHQTGGRGRLGRSFHSPAGGLYLSFLLRPECEPTSIMHLTCAAAVAACDAVEAACGFRPGIKWTNDLVWGKRKLGGILTELGLCGSKLDYAIIGIGINCSQQEFPGDIRHMAASLSTVCGKPVDPSAVESALLCSLERLSAELLPQKRAIMTRYRTDCITLGQEVSVVRGDETYRATALEVDEEGGLILRTPEGSTHTVTSGEVSVRGMYGYV